MAFTAAKPTDPLLAKKCATCGKWKARQEYYVSAKCLDGLHGSCKMCHSLQAKKRGEDPTVKERKRQTHTKWRNANKEHIRDYRARYKASNPEAHIEWRTRYKTRNAEAIRAKARIRYLDSRDDPGNLKRSREAAKRFREADPEKYSEKCKKDRRLRVIRIGIAIEICRSLGVDINKLAKEKYDAELRTREAAREKFHQDRGVAEKDSDGAGGYPSIGTDGRGARAA